MKRVLDNAEILWLQTPGNVSYQIIQIRHVSVPYPADLLCHGRGNRWCSRRAEFFDRTAKVSFVNMKKKKKKTCVDNV